MKSINSISVLFLVASVIFSLSCKRITDSINNDGIFQIAFTALSDSTWDIFFVNSDGSGLRNITNSPFHCGLLKFSQNGEDILFQKQNNPGSMDRVNQGVIQNLTTKQNTILFSELNGIGQIEFSPNGSNLVFSYFGSIYIINRDGSNLMELYNNNDSYYIQPVFSPDGSTIIFHNSSDMYSIGSDGSNFQVLLNNYGYIKNPQFSTDGSKIIFESRKSINSIKFNQTILNAPETIIEHNDFINNAVLSPNGSKICYQGLDSGVWYIYVSDIDGKNIIKLTEGELPLFSINGLQIVYKKDRDIYIIDVDGTNIKRLTFDGASGHIIRPTSNL